MGWVVSFLWSLAFMVVGELLRPKPRIDQPKPSSLGDIRFPTADEARIIPVAYGTVKVTGPNAIWWGDFKAVPITKKVKTGMFSSERITLAYQYHMGLQLALCWGTVDELIGLQFDDRDVVLLNRVNSADVVTFAMDAPTLFSSDDPANGLKGPVKFYNGTFTQIANSYLAQQFGEFTIPAYRGVCYAVFEKCYLSNNDSIPAIAWIIRRTPNPLGLTGGKHNIGGDANPACAVYEIMTNTFWGAGVPTSAIDTASFVAAADTLFNESLGISMLIDSPGTAEGMMAEILRHVDGVVFIDPETGKFSMKLARADYVVSSLPLLNPSNIEADSFKYTRGSWDETKNTVKVKYVDRAQNYTERVVQHQNLANISTRGGQVDADDFDFIGLSNPTAANIVAARVMKTVSSPLSRVDLQVNRTAFGLRPGSVFRLSWPQLGVAEVVFRVTEIDYGGSNTGVLQIKAVEDVFSTSFSSYINPPASGWVSPFGPVTALSRRDAFELPYAMQETPSGDRYVVTLGSPSRESDLGYRVWQDAAGGATFTQGTENRFNFTPNGQLASALTQNSAVTGLTLNLFNCYGTDGVSVPTAETVAAGGSLIRISSTTGEELLSFSGITKNGSSCTVTGVTRAIYDTVPLAHPAGATVWFVSEGMGYTQETPYTGDGATAIRLLPYNQRSSLPIGSATTINVTRSSRALEPYPPANLRVNATYLPATMTGALVLDWSHRDRLTQGKTPVAQNTGSVGPEATTTYTVRLYDETNTLRRTYSGLTGTTQTWDTEEADCGLLDVPVGSPPAEALGVRDACIYYYPLSETTGTTARDVQITSPINASYVGSYALNQTTLRTGGTPSVLVNSTGRIASSARPAEILSATTYSVSGWFRFTAWSSTYNTLCSVTEAVETEVGNFRLLVYVNASRQLVYAHEYGVGVDEVVTATGMTALALNTNYQIAVTVDQPTKTVRFYVNGALVDTRTYVNNLTGGTSANLRLVIGSDSQTGGTATVLNGRVQDVLFTTDLISATEITWLFNSGSGRSAQDTIGSVPRLNSRVRIELESVRGGLTSFTRHSYTVQRVGAQTNPNVAPGTLGIVGEIAGGVVSTQTSVLFVATGISGSAVWSLENSPSAASISGVGLFTFTPPSAGAYSVTVRLTDSPSNATIARTFNFSALGVAPSVSSVTGTLPKGYANVPYFALAAPSTAAGSEGVVVVRADANQPWRIYSSGLPDGLTVSDTAQGHVSGLAESAGSSSVVFNGGPFGAGGTSLSATLEMRPQPTFTVWNAFDRDPASNTIRFVDTANPLHTVRSATLSGQPAQARAINGMTSGSAPRYFEATIDSLPATAVFQIGIGVNAANRYDSQQYLGLKPGEWGYRLARFVASGALTPSVASNTSENFLGIPTAGVGNTVRVAVRMSGALARIWIAVENSPWIGGGSPDADTLPTFANVSVPAPSQFGDFRFGVWIFGDAQITANFGNQPWKFTPPSGFTGVPYVAPVNATTENVWDSDRAGRRGVLASAFAADYTPDPLGWARGVYFADPALITNPFTALASRPKSTGKWQFELTTNTNLTVGSHIGLVPFDWANNVATDPELPRPGRDAVSFGFALGSGTEPLGTGPADIYSANAVVGSIALSSSGTVFTLACDFDARTVAVRRNGTLIGTYTLPITGKPWVVACAGVQWANFTLRTRGLQYPQAGFTNWSLTGT